MQTISWDVTPQTQPTSTTCSPTALSILLGHYGDNLSPQEIEDSVPQGVDENGIKAGTINQQMATWCISRGYDVAMYTFDCQVIDQSWAKLEEEELLKRLELRKNGWIVPSMGKDWTEQYTQWYIDFIEAGGKLTITNAVTTKLLHELLQKGPILPCVSFSTMYGAIRSRIESDSKSPADDINGRALNHSIVIYGIDEKGNYKIADPSQSKKPGLHTIEPEVMLAAISTAQIECDNLIFQLSTK